MIDDRGHRMIIPAVRIIPGDDDDGTAPFWRLHDFVDRRDQELLFKQRIRITGMTILITRRFQEGNPGQPVGMQRVRKAGDIVLVVRLICLTDHKHRSRREVVWIGGFGIILEWVVGGGLSGFLENVASGGGGGWVYKIPPGTTPGAHGVY